MGKSELLYILHLDSGEKKSIFTRLSFSVPLCLSKFISIDNSKIPSMAIDYFFFTINQIINKKKGKKAYFDNYMLLPIFF